MHSILWRRIDVTGMEACAINRVGSGILISGAALHVAGDTPVRVEYTVNCTSNWECVSATVDRWLGPDKKEISLQRLDDGRWTADGCALEQGDAQVDIDLGFTPVTNTNAIKRLDLSIGDSRELTAVWLDDQTWSFKPLKQRYERVSENIYKYVSVESGYEAELTVDKFGLVLFYPGLWEAVIA